MRKAQRRIQTNESEHNYWPSFADVMSALVLVLFFLMVLTFIQNIITGDSLKKAKSELASTELNLIQAARDLDDATLELQNAQMDIGLAQDELLELQEDIRLANNIIIDKELALALSQTLIDEQNDTISLTNSQLEEIRIQMQGIAMLRMNILTEVKEALEQSLSESETTQETQVTISDNANIVIGGSFLFETNLTEISENAKPVLTQLAHAFYQVLSTGDTKDKIDSITIAGHTDDRGSTQLNWELSTSRAQAVVNYLFEVNPKLESEYGDYFSAAGYGENRPLAPNDTVENRTINRRIEVAIVVKDSAITDLINEYLGDDMFSEGG